MYITDLQYFGTIGYIKSIALAKEVYFDNEHPYSKMSFKNRMVIATAQGPLHLSIPLIGGRDQKVPISNIMIDYSTNWQDHHFKAILSNYQRSPFFEYYKDALSDLYNTKPTLLVDALLTTQAWVKKQLKIQWEVIDTPPVITVQRSFDSWLPKNYQLYPNPVKYNQVFEDRTGFLPNLCILDLLFCCGGKQAKQLLMSF
jgi:hypothetical protein